MHLDKKDSQLIDQKSHPNIVPILKRIYDQHTWTHSLYKDHNLTSSQKNIY